MNIYFFSKTRMHSIKNNIFEEPSLSIEFHLKLHTYYFAYRFFSYKSILSNYRFYLRKKEMSRKI